MVILGIDPGYATIGYGVIEKTPKGLMALDYGVIKTPPDEMIAVRLAMIDEAMTSIMNKFKKGSILHFCFLHKTAEPFNCLSKIYQIQLLYPVIG